MYDPCRWFVTPATINFNGSSFQNEGRWLATDTTLAREMLFLKKIVLPLFKTFEFQLLFNIPWAAWV